MNHGDPAWDIGLLKDAQIKTSFRKSDGYGSRIEANLPVVGGSLGTLRSVAGGVPPPRIAEPLAHAFGQTFWWAVGLTALALIPAAFLPRQPAVAVEATPVEA